MTQISRDSKEITTALMATTHLDAVTTSGTSRTLDTERFNAFLGYITVTNRDAAFAITAYVECSPDNVTFYRTHGGGTGDTQGNHNVAWLAANMTTAGSGLMIIAWPVGRWTRLVIDRTGGSADVEVSGAGMKS